MVHERKNILLIVPHMPAFDSCIPLMIRLEDDSPQSQHVTLQKTYGNLSDKLDKAAMIVEQ